MKVLINGVVYDSQFTPISVCMDPSEVKNFMHDAIEDCLAIDGFRVLHSLPPCIDESDIDGMVKHLNEKIEMSYR